MAEADPVVDWTIFTQARSEMGPGFIRVLGYFREDGEKSIARIEEAMRRQDAAALVTPADTLKTEARQFGAEPLGDLAEEIEVAARRAVESHIFPDHLLPTVARLRPLYAEVVMLFEQETNPLAQRRPGAARSGAGEDDLGRT